MQSDPLGEVSVNRPVRLSINIGVTEDKSVQLTGICSKQSEETVLKVMLASGIAVHFLIWRTSEETQSPWTNLLRIIFRASRVGGKDSNNEGSKPSQSFLFRSTIDFAYVFQFSSSKAVNCAAS